MPPKEAKFERNGDFALEITRYLIRLAKEVKLANLDPVDADYDWGAFSSSNKDLVDRIVAKHPSKSKDKRKKARDNFLSQKTRFLNWLVTGKGKSSSSSLHFLAFLVLIFIFVLSIQVIHAILLSKLV